ncbi:LacI family DNA-binding transcriptional regulator [Methylibium rhizosphaerae]|uniref:LacI family DNA-binding transcriptional regulator n=1 Tax=Methylibium rhizosphaerae TaxID=2570323 RepID=UPI001FE8325A|nr:substrate-binding domain-containing protein [Methylibium rhizosphaerae]
MPASRSRARPAPAPVAPAGPTTVIDVARVAGVSASTVSRILNGTARVADSKRAAVEEAIRRLDFRPNLSARSLKMGTTMTVGILAQDIESPFFTRAMRGIEEGLADSGYAPIIVSGHWNAVEEAQRIRLLMARRIDGLVILTGHLADEQIAEFARHQPIVVTGRKLRHDHNLVATWLDQTEAGYLATRHLLSLGHRRIAHIAGPRDHGDAVDRLAGYNRAHEEANLKPDPALVTQGDFLESGGLLAMNRLLDSGAPFTAVFAANDQMSYGARMALYRRGIRVPDDVSIVGVDDLPASAYVTPPLTTVRQPIYEIGLFAARALLHMLGQRVEPVDVPPLELIVRETTRRL